MKVDKKQTANDILTVSQNVVEIGDSDSDMCTQLPLQSKQLDDERDGSDCSGSDGSDTEPESQTLLTTLPVVSTHSTVRYGDIYSDVGGSSMIIRSSDVSIDKWQQALSVYQRLVMSEVMAEKELAYRSLTSFISNSEIPSVYRLHAFRLLWEMELTTLQDEFLREITLTFFNEVVTKNNGWCSPIFTDILRAMMELSLSEDQFVQFMKTLKDYLQLDTAKVYYETTKGFSLVNSITITALCNIWSIILDLAISFKINTQSKDAILQLDKLEEWALTNFRTLLHQELSSKVESSEESSRLLNYTNYTGVIDRISRCRDCLTMETVTLIINDYVERWESYIQPHEIEVTKRINFHTKRILTIITSIKYNHRDEARMLRMDYTSLPSAIRWDEFGISIIRMVTADDETMIQKYNEKVEGYTSIEIIQNLYFDERNTAKAWGRVLANYHLFTSSPPSQTINGKWLFLDTLACSKYTFHSYIIDLCLLVYRESRDPWEKQKVVEKLIVIGEDDTMDPDIRGLAIDKLLQTHNLMYEKKANAIIEGMNAESRAEALKKRGVVYRLFDDAENSHNEAITKSTEESVINLDNWYYTEFYKFHKKQAENPGERGDYEYTKEEKFHKEQVENGELMGKLIEIMREWSISNPKVVEGISFQKVDHTLRRCYVDRTVVTFRSIRAREVIGYICAYINSNYIVDSDKYFDLYRNLYINLEDSYKTCGTGVINRVVPTLIGVTDMVNQLIDPMDAIINRLKARYNSYLRKLDDIDLQTQLMLEMTLEAPELRKTYESWRKTTVVKVLTEIRKEDLEANDGCKAIWGDSQETHSTVVWPQYKGKPLNEYDPLTM